MQQTKSKPEAVDQRADISWGSNKGAIRKALYFQRFVTVLIIPLSGPVHRFRSNCEALHMRLVVCVRRGKLRLDGCFKAGYVERLVI